MSSIMSIYQIHRASTHATAWGFQSRTAVRGCQNDPNHQGLGPLLPRSVQGAQIITLRLIRPCRLQGLLLMMLSLIPFIQHLSLEFSQFFSNRSQRFPDERVGLGGAGEKKQLLRITDKRG
eukprot:6475284-Amphidinium_carterae.1